MHCGRIAGHGVDAAIGCARAGPDDRQRLGRETVDPLGCLDRLAGVRVGALRRPIALILDVFVRDRSFNDQHERVNLPAFGLIEVLHEIVADLVGQHRIMEVHLGQARDRAHDHVLEAGLLGSGYGD